MEYNLKTSQKILLIIMYSLIILMIVFSFQAGTMKGEKGYLKCIEKKCPTYARDCNIGRIKDLCCRENGWEVIDKDIIHFSHCEFDEKPVFVE